MPLAWKKPEADILMRLRQEYPEGTATWKYIADRFNEEVDEDRHRSHWSLCWKYKTLLAEEEARLRDAQITQNNNPRQFHNNAPVSQDQHTTQSNMTPSCSHSAAATPTTMQNQPTNTAIAAGHGQTGFPHYTCFQTENQTYYPGTSYYTQGSRVAAPPYAGEYTATPSQWAAINRASNQHRGSQNDSQNPHQQQGDNDESWD